MSTNGFENCVSGTFYGFTNSQNNEFHPGDVFNLQWGAIDGGKTALNISLGRVGGTLIDRIAGALALDHILFSSCSMLSNIQRPSRRLLHHQQQPLPTHRERNRKLYPGAIQATPRSNFICWNYPIASDFRIVWNRL